MKKKLFIFSFVCLGAFAAIAQKETPPSGGAAKDFKLSEKKNQKYTNGLKSTMVHYGNTPKTTISLVIKTGNVHETTDQVWLADLTGRMLREGTARLNFAELAKKAAMMGGNLNVNVGMTQTTITGAVLSEYAPEFIKLIGELVTNPAFPASELERLKVDLKRRLTVQKAVPQAQAQDQFYQAVYGDQRYGKTFPTEAMINGYTTETIKQFYDQNFGAKRSVIYVVGKFDEAAVKQAIESGLTKWKAGPEVFYPKINAVPVADTMIIDRKGAPQTTVMLGLPVITPDNKDYVPLLVTNSLLGGSFGSRITTNIREDKGYTYSPSSAVSNRKGSTLWFEQADVTSEHTVASMQEIEKEIRKLQETPPSKEELAGIQNYEAGIFVLQNSSPAGIIGQLNFLDLYGLPDSYLSTLVKNIHSVTPEKVSETAKNYIQYDKMTKVLVGDKDVIEQQVKKQKEKLKAF
ncbi:MAG: insulinase family protein [Chitinophagaceae bacterium]|nr:insulinase family protein [Chitinophagaceae bacterium]